MGVPIKLVHINSVSELNTAIAGGSVDFGLGGSSDIAAGLSTGIAYEIIWIYDVMGDIEALVAKKGDATDEKSCSALWKGTAEQRLSGILGSKGKTRRGIQRIR